jgi:hypothetical protein
MNYKIVHVYLGRDVSKDEKPKSEILQEYYYISVNKNFNVPSIAILPADSCNYFP